MRKILAASGRIIVVAIILTAIQIAANLFMGMGAYSRQAGWALLSNVLIVLVLAWCIMRARSMRMRLIVAVFLVYWGIYVFNTNIEALFFGLDIPAKESVGIMALGTALALIGAVILAFLFGAKGSGEMAGATENREGDHGHGIFMALDSMRSSLRAALFDRRGFRVSLPQGLLRR